MDSVSAGNLRRSRISEATQGNFDVIVIGGGIHGASVCREAVLRGYRTLLLEANDYAFGTSSRSSKLLHGGVRYLEQGDILLVREALQERARMLSLAAHLARPQRMYFPIFPGMTRPAWQVGIGLSLYDVLARAFANSGRAARCFQLHRRVSKKSPKLNTLISMGLRPSTVFSYFDGQMDDTRIVIENIVDSVHLGATTLNYAHIEEFLGRSQGSQGWTVRWCDRLSGGSYQSTASVLVNVAGPWVPAVHCQIMDWPSHWPNPVYSRGIHLTFDKPWPAPGLILPTGIKGRYYFVLPYFSPNGSATLVGTTDRRVNENDPDPRATEDEVKELLEFLQRDLPESGLTRRTLSQSFCGMRILAGRKGRVRSEKVSDVSRSEYILEGEAYVALLGGKYTTARATAEKIVNKVDCFSGTKRTRKEREGFSRTRVLPGAKGWSEPVCRRLCEELLTELTRGANRAPKDHKADESLDPERLKRDIEGAVRRFGVRARDLGKNLDEIADPRDPGLLLWIKQIRLAVLEEHAQTVEDVLERRFGMDDFPGQQPPLFELTKQVLSELTEFSEEELENNPLKPV